MFDLLAIVDLQQVVPTVLNLRQLLVVLKEIHWERHLARGPCSWSRQEKNKRLEEALSSKACSVIYLVFTSTSIHFEVLRN